MTLLNFITLLLMIALSLSSCQPAAVQTNSSTEKDSTSDAEKGAKPGADKESGELDESGKARPGTILRFPITQVGSETLTESLVLPGIVLALPDHSVKVSPGIAGKIVDIKVALGAQVKKGQLIAQLDDRLLKNQVNQAHAKILVAQAGVQQAKTSLLLAENTAERNARLVQQDVGAEKDLVAAKSQVETCKAQILAAEAQVEDANAAEAAAVSQMNYTLVKSPHAGLVAQRYLNIGDSADTNTPILQIIDLDPVVIDASLPTTQPAKIVKGQTATITAKAVPELKLTGTVQNENVVTDNQGTTIGVRIICRNQKHELKEGMPVVTTIVTAVHPQAVTVPAESIVSDPNSPDKKMVYIFKAGKISRVPVTTGIQNKARIEILTGLKPGESIVVGGAYGIPDGTEVEAESEPLHSNSKVTSKSN